MYSCFLFFRNLMIDVVPCICFHRMNQNYISFSNLLLKAPFKNSIRDIIFEIPKFLHTQDRFCMAWSIFMIRRWSTGDMSVLLCLDCEFNFDVLSRYLSLSSLSLLLYYVPVNALSWQLCFCFFMNNVQTPGIIWFTCPRRCSLPCDQKVLFFSLCCTKFILTTPV